MVFNQNDALAYDSIAKGHVNHLRVHCSAFCTFDMCGMQCALDTIDNVHDGPYFTSILLRRQLTVWPAVCTYSAEVD